jgi:chromosome segregation ATPase
MSDAMLLAIIELLGIILAGIVTYCLGKRKSTAEARKLKAEAISLLANADRAKAEVNGIKIKVAAELTRAASELVDDLQTEVRVLRGRILKLERKDREKAQQIGLLQKRITELEQENAKLRQQNRKLTGRFNERS